MSVWVRTLATLLALLAVTGCSGDGGGSRDVVPRDGSPHGDAHHTTCRAGDEAAPPIEGAVTLLGCPDECPPLAHYETACNAAGFCEYAYAGSDTADWRAYDRWIFVPPGRYPRGAPATEPMSYRDERPVCAVRVEGFFLGRYEVTTAAFEACEQAGVCARAARGANRTADSRGDHPQNGIHWLQADEVCAWLGGRLPTEAEWEYAAKGPRHRAYPWGDAPAPTCRHARHYSAWEGLGCGAGGTGPVGQSAAGAAWCGALDMAGNVAEWVADLYHESYEGAPLDGAVWTAPLGRVRVLRGGGYRDGPAGLRTAARNDDVLTYPGLDYGVRCARSVSTTRR